METGSLFSVLGRKPEMAVFLASRRMLGILGATILFATFGFAQVSVPMPGRVINKLLPDYSRPKVYALNQADGSGPGTLLALNPTNGAILGEITLNTNPVDMAMTSAGDALYIIHTGSRTIAKVDLATFSVVGEKIITTPNAYTPSTLLHIVAAQQGRIFYTDGGWSPQVYRLDFNTGSNTLVLDTGVGGLLFNRSENTFYTWRQYGWSAGSLNSWVTRFAVSTNYDLTPLEDSFTSTRRDPPEAPLLLDGAERWLFNKKQMFLATNLSVLISQFAETIYAISVDGTIAVGDTGVFSSSTGNMITNLSFYATVETLTGDQKKLFRFQASSATLVIYDMSTIASVSGVNPVPLPYDGAVVSLPVTNLSWTASPLALGYDVYFGTNQVQVAAATNGSVLHLGRVTAPPQSIPSLLSPGVTYYWRLDVIGFSSTNTGPVWSFTTSPLVVSPSQITYSTIAGYNPASLSLTLTSAVPVVWSAAVEGANWLSIDRGTGTTPSTIAVSVNSAGLTAGPYTNTINCTVGNATLVVPVSLNVVAALNITKMVADPQRPYLYAIQPPVVPGQGGLLLFINTTNGNIDNALAIGINPVDLSINRAESRLYIASWGETWTYVVDLETQTLLPSLNLATDVYKINAGRQGRLVTEGEDQWITGRLISTTNGAVLANISYREGDGDFEPSGRYYYHVDNNISSAGLIKYDTMADSFTAVAGNDGTRGSYYGSRNLIISQDGTRLFWTRVVFDADLVDYDMVPDEVYGCSTNGRVAFGNKQAYDSQTCQLIYNLPVTTTVSVVDGQNQRYWYFANGLLGSIPMGVIQSPTITTNLPANVSVANGGSLALTVSAMGVSPLSYQWMVGGIILPGKTNSILNQSFPQGGSYCVVVSNPFGAVTSSVAQVSLLPPWTGYNDCAWTALNTSGTNADVAAFAFTTNSPLRPAGGSLIFTNGLATSARVSFATNSATGLTFLDRQFQIPTGTPLEQTFSGHIGTNNTINWTRGTVTMTLSGLNTSRQYTVVIWSSRGGTTASYSNRWTDIVIKSVDGFVNNSSPGLVRFQTTATQDSTRVVSVIEGGLLARYEQVRSGVDSNIVFDLVANGLGSGDTNGYLNAFMIQEDAATSYIPFPVVSPSTSLTFTGQVYSAISSQLLTVTNTGTGSVSYRIDADARWLGVSNALGTLSPGMSTTHVVTVSSRGLSARSYEGRLALVDLSGDDTASVVPVSLRVRYPALPTRVVPWGQNGWGQTNVPVDLTNGVQIAAGAIHSVVLCQDGTVRAWGFNDYGQTNVPPGLTNAVAVACGSFYSMALKGDGHVSVWGSSVVTNTPGALSNVIEIAAGGSHCLALRSDGTVVAWGNNSYGVTNVPAGLTNAIGVAAGTYHSVVLRADGSIIAWGLNDHNLTEVPDDLTNAVDIKAGVYHSLALLADGEVVGWGRNSGSEKTPPDDLTNAIALAAADQNSMGLTEDGRVIEWGDNSWGKSDVPPDLGKALGIAAGGTHSMALVLAAQARITLDTSTLGFTGQVYSAMAGQTLTISNSGNATLNYTIASDIFWLSVSNRIGVLAPGMSTTHVVTVSTRGLESMRPHVGHLTITDPNAANSPTAVSVALTLSPVVTPSKVVAWGNEGYGQANVPAGLTNAVAVAGGMYHSVVLSSDGRVVAWGRNDYGQANVPAGLTNAVAVAAGAWHTVALRADGTVAVWGGHDYGETNVPVGLTNAVAVAAGWAHSLALRANGTVSAWGYNFNGQADVPVGLTNVVAIAAGSFHSLALRADGTVVGWGQSIFGEADVPVGLTNAVAVAAGFSDSLVLCADGTVIAWGYNSSGQTDVPVGLTDVVAVAGAGPSLALRADGTVVAWGDIYGQTNVPAEVTNAVAIAAGYIHSMALVPVRSLVVTSDYGSPVPGVGTNWPTRGTAQSLMVDEVVEGGTQYVITGWFGTGDVPASGTSNSVDIMVTQDSTITWNWRTNYWLELSANNGTFNTNGGWYSLDSTVIVTATNQPGYRFGGWSGDTNGCIIEGLQITIPMSFARSIEVIFDVPVVSVLTTNLHFDGPLYSAIAAQPLIVSNAGSVPLHYTLTSDMFWLGVTNPAGDLATGQSTTHIVRVDTRGLSSRTYLAHLAVIDPLAPTGSMVVGVDMNLHAPNPPSQIQVWGDNTYKQTKTPSSLSNAIAVSAGAYHTVVLRSDGTVVAWGANESGQTNVPAGLSNVIGVAAGWNHSMALMNSGAIIPWGDGGEGQTNIPSGLSNVVAISAGRHYSLALRANGSVLAWGRTAEGETKVPASLTNAVMVSAGRYHALALQSDGSVTAWGDNDYGQSDVPVVLTRAVSVAAGGGHSLALRPDGIVVAWGRNSDGQATVPVALSNVVAVAAGQNHSMALCADGHVWAWGEKGAGRTNVPPNLPAAFSVSAGRDHSVALYSLVVLSSNAVPSWWLQAHGLQTNAQSAELVLDPDGDGMTTWEEYVADRDPTNRSSLFQVDSVTKAPIWSVTFLSSTGRVYSLEIAPGIVTPLWTNVPGQINIPGNGGTLTLTNTNPPSYHHYYRVRVALP